MFVREQQTCHWCKEPMPDPLPDGVVYEGKGWIHPECRVAKQVADRLLGKSEVYVSYKGIEVRNRSRFAIERKV